jgi:hypothetical protein
MRGADGRWFCAAFALCGLGMAAHPNALWVVLALLVGATIASKRPTLPLLASAIGLMLLGLTLYAYLPLRSAYVVSHGIDPTSRLAGTIGGIFWNYNDPRTLHGLALELSGSESQTPAYFLASLNPAHLADALWAFLSELHAQYGTFGALLLVAGLTLAWRRDWRATLVLVVAGGAGLVFSVVYPNESDVERYRMLVAWVAVPLFGALTPRSRDAFAATLHAALVLFIGISAANDFAHQRNFFQHAPREGGRWVIDAVLPYVPQGSVIVTRWLDATSLAYGAYADRSLPNRIIVSDDAPRIERYRAWTNGRRVFILVDPHDVEVIAGARDYAHLDDYHELFEVRP